MTWPRLADDLLARTDGVGLIEIDHTLNQVARRCALDHELAHIELGHVGGCTPEAEHAARQLSARRLLPIKLVAQSMAYSLDLNWVADDLWVVRPVLDDRLAHLTDGERAVLHAATAHHRDYL